MSLTPDFLETCRGHKILIIEPFYWTPHVETGLELAEILSEQNQITYVGPDVLRSATDGTARFVSRMQYALSRKRTVSRYVTPKARVYGRAEIETLERRLNLPNARTFLDPTSSELEHLKFDKFDVGMGVVSSLISLTRDVHYDRERHSELATALGQEAMKLYLLTQELVRANDCDIVILFNGRVAAARGIRRACEAMGVRYIVHERGSSRDKFALFDCSTPHLPDGIRRWADDWWRVSADPEASGRAFLEKRRKNVATSWYSFTGKQSAGNCPPRDGRRRVTFFTSSDDELIAIGDELPPDSPYCDQVHAVRSIGQACRDRNSEFIVRFHPNTPPTQQDLVAAAREVTPLVFEPASDVDSYALIDSSDVVFTQNSTVGIEAAAVGKPTFYAGRNVFEGCRSIGRVMTDADVAAAVQAAEPPADPIDALRYANYFGEHGIRYRYFEPRGFLSGTYRGCDLNGPLSALRDFRLRLTRGGA
jgi:hypothetical protein